MSPEICKRLRFGFAKQQCFGVYLWLNSALLTDQFVSWITARPSVLCIELAARNVSGIRGKGVWAQKKGTISKLGWMETSFYVTSTTAQLMTRNSSGAFHRISQTKQRLFAKGTTRHHL
ncbi:hypothetical protein CEXT_69281 [Caerostris extrusa]|uniref:Uncharacterized protein n=1 Tax=Caerostris extrusa TaxID=172846 RepID=A0AAV4MCE1_CAEEX|nr:hypothetical protein CEXT_69281 [Caerostris extrusa]